MALLDALGLDRADVVGNSMGGRVALEVGLRHPERVGRLGLLAPSLAWLRARPWAPLLRLVPPQLGAPAADAARRGRGASCAASSRAPRTAGRRPAWTSSCGRTSPRAGRAAFYAAARGIYLEEPHGRDGFWTRLPELQPPALFVWGRRDRLVPLAFAGHVRRALPDAEHLELDCGHVPQLERPRATHDALRRFLVRGAPR